MLLQTQLLFLLVICTHCAWGEKETVGDYMKHYSDMSPVEDQVTIWDRASLPADKNITYPVEGQPVPEIVVSLLEDGEKEETPKDRDKRQIHPDSCFLLFANRAHIVKFQNVPSVQISVALTGFSNAVAVDFDKRDGYLFWSDVALRRIYRSNVDGTGLTTLVYTQITTPDGIAWDWVNKKLYWTDVDDKDLEVLDVSTGYRRKIFQFPTTSKPRAIVVDPSTRYMYWTDWGSPAKIERAAMDGSNRAVLHTVYLYWPNALTIDYTNQRLYWMDALFNRIESSNVDGSNRIFHTSVNVLHPFSVTFFQGNLFWSDWQLNAILAAPVSNLAATNVLLGELTLDPMGVTAACIERQPLAYNPCAGRCGYFYQMCLLSTNYYGYSCVTAF